MRVPVQIITGFSCFLFVVTFVQGQAINCTAPDIPNGEIIDRMSEYLKDDTLKYNCSKGFKPREGTPICSSFGWTPNPECDAVTCEIKLTTFRITLKSIKPERKTIFRAGERVEITCTDRIFTTKETNKTFTCQDDGEWDDEPACHDTDCIEFFSPHPYDPHLNLHYACEGGGNQHSKWDYCSKGVLRPKPLCPERTCPAPEIPNAEIEGDLEQIYRIKSKIQYKCRPGFEPQQIQQITCDFVGRWGIIQPCTSISKPDIVL